MSDSPRSEDSHNRRRRRSSVSDTEDGNTIGKKRRIDSIEVQPQLAVHRSHASKRLGYHDYTVGWVCALSIEMTAAMATLDEEHEALPRKAGDDNIYVLGSISGHNVVIACLRDGVYGIASATTVGQAMRRTFPKSITLPLMVGIGGGVPSVDRDIRLGDVVVGVPTSKGPAVKQYDLGKTTSEGLPEVTGELNKPAAILLHAISKLKATRELRPGNHAMHISRTLAKHGLDKYAYPGSEHDTLFKAHCNHYLQSDTCESTCSLRCVDREPRTNTNPVIHYGTVGSGNQVIKHSGMRDRIAKNFGIICFEMEAAGLMDNFPCLVIRGICDYCDAQKDKSFQKFAALSAAAYAKDLLSEIPVEESSVLAQSPKSIPSSNQEHRKSIMKALNFEEAESRRATVKKAHLQTCKWFVGQQFFVDWHDMQHSDDHHGLLWIKGKPGTGKSTLMKFLLEKEEKARTNDQIVISFFFNARGDVLERSVVGMYRSLIHQLLKQIPQLQSLLDNFSSSTTFEQDKVGVVENLENLFRSVVEKFPMQQVFCFVDALDECPEGQIRDMLSIFEELGAIISDSNIKFHVLLSSRHYPNITTEHGRSITLEEQPGHSGDLLNYINSELRIGKRKQIVQIKQAILEKARGIFLWVVLTLKILRIEHDKGRLQSPMKRLDDIPLELNELFRDIITRDNERLPELILCVQWILYAKRPLLHVELYSALLVGNDPMNESPYDLEDVSTDVMDNYILDCSKGLVELTRARKPTVQFIHESVREFLLQPEALIELWPGFQGISEGTTHQQLRDICNTYLRSNDVINFEVDTRSMSYNSVKALRRFPFLKYVAECIFHHADMTEQFHLSQDGFLKDFPWGMWLELYNSIQERPSHRLDYTAIGYAYGRLKNDDINGILGKLNSSHLLTSRLSLEPPEKSDLIRLVEKLGGTRSFETYQQVLLWQWKRDRPIDEVCLNHTRAWFELLQDARYLRIASRTRAVIEMSLYWPTQFCERSTVLRCIVFAASVIRPAALRLLLSGSIDKASGCSSMSLLQKVVEKPFSFRLKRVKISTTITDNASLEYAETPQFANLTSDVLACVDVLYPEQEDLDYNIDLVEVAERFGIIVVDSIIKKGLVKANSKVFDHLHRAVQRNNTKLVQILLEYGADTSARYLQGQTLLHQAQAASVAQLLIQYGLDVNSRDDLGGTPLTSALLGDEHYNRLLLILCLLQHKVNTNIKTNLGRPPLHSLTFDNWSSPYNREAEIALKLFLTYGADINVQDTDGDTTLHKAVINSRSEFVKLLILEGADPNFANFKSFSPLHTAAMKFARSLNENDRTLKALSIDTTSKHILTILYTLGAEPTVPTQVEKENADWPRFVEILEALQTLGRPELKTIFDTDFLEKWNNRGTEMRLDKELSDQSEVADIEADTTQSISDFGIDLSHQV